MDVKRKWHACTKVIFQSEKASKNNSVLYQNNYVDNVTAWLYSFSVVLFEWGIHLGRCGHPTTEEINDDMSNFSNCINKR